MTMKAHGRKEAYEVKQASYFTGIRQDFVDQMPENPIGKILEIGCGHGGTGEYALKQKKACEYHGVEIDAASAEVASQKLTSVITGDVESLELPWPDEYFDCLIMSEVLEHLVDPWALLIRLRKLLKPNALAFASSPNIAQFRVIKMLLRGKWELDDRGLMDRTHLRWFTPDSFEKMFHAADFDVLKVWPLSSSSILANALIAVSFRIFDHMRYRQICLMAKTRSIAAS